VLAAILAGIHRAIVRDFPAFVATPAACCRTLMIDSNSFAMSSRIPAAGVVATMASSMATTFSHAATVKFAST
jgi:hypothetical protein